MGRSVLEVLLADPQARLAAAIDRQGHAALGQDAAVLVGRMEPLRVQITEDIDKALSQAQVVIDFSSPAATVALLERCAVAKVSAVVGTTGMDDACRRALETLATLVPVVASPNYSIGVNVLLALAERAVKLAGAEFDLEITEMHHRHKVDAPSGTAMRLAEVAARARGLNVARSSVNGRAGQVGPRRAEEIGVHALRGGDVVGDHTLVLAGPGERLELTHRAHGREIFARGALRAAHWVVNRRPGLYDMADVLGIR
jgi:4-hydroxy-tetrahydrodipicolinate reductase